MDFRGLCVRWAIKEIVSEQLPNFISGIIQLIGSLIILFFMDWKMASLMFLSVPVFVLIMKPIGITMMKLGNQLQLSIAELVLLQSFPKNLF